MTDTEEDWPALPLAAWEPTRATLHMWTQIVGKVRLALSPYLNHWWQVPLYVSPRGLTTSAIPCKGQSFEIEFDFIEHALFIRKSDGATKALRLEPKSVAAFHAEFMATLHALGIEVKIWTMPVEIPDPIAFDKDTLHAAYDPEYAARFWRVLVCIDTVFKEFRGRFIGKASPVHFFWGSFDLAVTRFSGRRAPPMPAADLIVQAQVVAGAVGELAAAEQRATIALIEHPRVTPVGVRYDLVPGIVLPPEAGDAVAGRVHEAVPSRFYFAGTGRSRLSIDGWRNFDHADSSPRREQCDQPRHHGAGGFFARARRHDRCTGWCIRTRRLEARAGKQVPAVVA